MHNSNQGGVVCAALLDVFGLFAQVLHVLCSHNIHFLKILVTKQKNTDSEQFSDNSLSLSCMHACMTQMGTTTWKLVKRLDTTGTI